MDVQTEHKQKENEQEETELKMKLKMYEKVLNDVKIDINDVREKILKKIGSFKKALEKDREVIDECEHLMYGNTKEYIQNLRVNILGFVWGLVFILLFFCFVIFLS